MTASSSEESNANRSPSHAPIASPGAAGSGTPSLCAARSPTGTSDEPPCCWLGCDGGAARISYPGSADVQVASGMAGAIIVKGDFADVPEIARARERVMVLMQVVSDAFYMIEDFGTLFPETSMRFLAINGQRRPTIDMRPGEVQRADSPLKGSGCELSIPRAIRRDGKAVIAAPSVEGRNPLDQKNIAEPRRWTGHGTQVAV